MIMLTVCKCFYFLTGFLLYILSLIFKNEDTCLLKAMSSNLEGVTTDYFLPLIFVQRFCLDRFWGRKVTLGWVRRINFIIPCWDRIGHEPFLIRIMRDHIPLVVWLISIKFFFFQFYHFSFV